MDFPSNFQLIRVLWSQSWCKMRFWITKNDFVFWSSKTWLLSFLACKKMSKCLGKTLDAPDRFFMILNREKKVLYDSNKDPSRLLKNVMSWWNFSCPFCVVLTRLNFSVSDYFCFYFWKWFWKMLQINVTTELS